MAQEKICAIIPCFNEERFVYEVTKDTQKYVDGVIVVDDGSTDDTYKEAMKTGAIVLSHPENQGKGEALRTGIKKALEQG
ncbi:MAG: glycosyltransferase, partial [Candidatus Ranarchaeia archaeon]